LAKLKFDQVEALHVKAGMAGVLQQLPVDEKHNFTRAYCQGRIAIMMGGRVAEELVFNEVTNGAKGDIDMATNLARRMCCEWGMSERLGPIALGRGDEQVFLGREIVEQRHVSEETAEAIDEEVRGLVEQGRKTAREILTKERDVLSSLAMALLERETLDEEEVRLLIARSPLPTVTARGADVAPHAASSPIGESPSTH
jgi:cell division protease FtsH